ncbi:MAG: cob(I)yrinic acid a,c-diamide adenosyltransferase [Candidatus Azobacteroides sp.]|nr:cob(I)yrinic acid a,c-diamide adenosyltransferase [Candidatus Azobacteroides sp.]
MEKDNFKSKIYTKSGDKGSTSLIGGKKVSKSDARLNAYGTIDELNSFIGLLIEETVGDGDGMVLRNIQSLLFVIGCELATEPDKECFRQLQESDIDMLEKEIDRMDATLPKLSGFVMPGGSRSVAVSHICRTICRRAERCICELSKSEFVDDQIIKFVNRLSDYFFVLARNLCHVENKDEIFWHNTCK